MKKEINSLLFILNEKANKIFRYEEDILDELKKKLFSNKGCVQINNKISELKFQNKEHVLVSLCLIITYISLSRITY